MLLQTGFAADQFKSLKSGKSCLRAQRVAFEVHFKGHLVFFNSSRFLL